MKKLKKTSLAFGILVVIVLIASIIVIKNGVNEFKPIGGERDEHGCLGPAGYSWNETLQVCLREWEITGVNRQIVYHVMKTAHKEYGLTIDSIIPDNNCSGCFTLWLDTLGRKRSIGITGELNFYCTEEQRGEGVYCIQVYEPVCGSDKKTYSNGCMACLNKNIEYYIEGECQ